MTEPTKALCPMLLEDCRKLSAERRGEQGFYTSEMIRQCMDRVTTVKLHESIYLDTPIMPGIIRLFIL